MDRIFWGAALLVLVVGCGGTAGTEGAFDDGVGGGSAVDGTPGHPVAKDSAQAGSGGAVAAPDAGHPSQVKPSAGDAAAIEAPEAAAVVAKPSCSDGIKNQSETDVDCGGICSPCAVDMGCAGSWDCDSRLCDNGWCVAPVQPEPTKDAGAAPKTDAGAAPTDQNENVRCGDSVVGYDGQSESCACSRDGNGQSNKSCPSHPTKQPSWGCCAVFPASQVPMAGSPFCQCLTDSKTCDALLKDGWTVPSCSF